MSNHTPIKIDHENLSMAVIIQQKRNHTELAQYLHAVCVFPWTFHSFKGYTQFFSKTWPGLTPDLLKYLPTSISTVQGHFHQE